MSSRRAIIVGDVHGCREELEALLAAVRFAPGTDALFFVGDVTVRGPDSRGVLELIARLGARVVRGNHEERLLQGRHDPTRLQGEHRHLAASLSESEWQRIEAMPLWIDVPDHDLRIVHAGVVPGLPVEAAPRDALLRIRAVDGDGGWTDDKKAEPLWGAVYRGPPHVVFGHNALSDPQLHEWATGIDTGCVYGGRLTALTLGPNERVPRGTQALSKLTSVPARRAYSPMKRPSE